MEKRSKPPEKAPTADRPIKIILILQARTDAPRAARCDAAAFARAAEAAVFGHAVSESVRKSDASSYRIYTGTRPASAETVEMLFELSEPPVTTALLDDVPLLPFRETSREYPLWLWKALGEVQRLVGSACQRESGRETVRRAKEVADLLEHGGRDCVVVAGTHMMRALRSVLRRRGYLLEGSDLFPKPLERVRATKRALHCGGCRHNCLLTEPKCRIGREKALERGITARE